MKKTYIIDTSVIVYDPFFLEKFKNSNIILQIHVLNELDKIKKVPTDTGRNARVFIRFLDEICASGNISKGIKIDNGITLSVDTILDDISEFGEPDYVDNKILACAKRHGKTTKPKAILVSRDINLRVRAKSFGINSQIYEKEDGTEKRYVDRLYSGVKHIANAELSGTLCAENLVNCNKFKGLDEILPNECVYVTDDFGGGITLGRKINDKVKIVRNGDKNLWGIRTRNKEQAFAVDLLLDPKIHLVSLIGKAGTGKTLLAVAAGLEQLINKKIYEKIIVYRPIQPVGNELGYLPGSLEDKLAPWMDAVKDCFDFLTSKYDTSKSKRRKRSGSSKESSQKDWRERLGQYSDDIYMEPITYVRGRSIPNTYIIVDEAQNLSPKEIKTMLTRAGSDTKIVLTGDIEQTDGKFLDATNNGLTHVANAFRESPYAGHVTLVKGERSILATEAARIL
jgi:PhoH-like ATPase